MKAKYLFFVPLFFLYLCSQAQTASRLIAFANRASTLDSVIYIYNTNSRGNHVLSQFDPAMINAIIPLSHIDVGYGAEVSASEPGIIQYDTAYTYSIYGPLAPRVRGYHEFDSHNNITSFTDQIFDSVAGWQNDFRDLYTYDSDQYITQQLFQEWDGSSWQNYRLNTYLYSAGHIDTATVKLWDNTGHVWGNSKHSIYSYDSESRLINIVFWYMG